MGGVPENSVRAAKIFEHSQESPKRSSRVIIPAEEEIEEIHPENLRKLKVILHGKKLNGSNSHEFCYAISFGFNRIETQSFGKL